MSGLLIKGTVRFRCPRCGQMSIESILAASDSQFDAKEVANAVAEHLRPIACQLFKLVCPDGVEIELRIENLPTEQLGDLGAAWGPQPKHFV